MKLQMIWFISRINLSIGNSMNKKEIIQNLEMHKGRHGNSMQYFTYACTVEANNILVHLRREFSDVDGINKEKVNIINDQQAEFGLTHKQWEKITAPANLPQDQPNVVLPPIVPNQNNYQQQMQFIDHLIRNRHDLNQPIQYATRMARIRSLAKEQRVYFTDDFMPAFKAGRHLDHWIVWNGDPTAQLEKATLDAQTTGSNKIQHVIADIMEYATRPSENPCALLNPGSDRTIGATYYIPDPKTLKGCPKKPTGI
jgi:5-methylcytosine-specific restriction endonuclease McrBC GTP-binding regulatory subunit McrB